MIGVTPINGDWARLPIFLAELTGIHPTVEGIAVQAALLATFVAGAPGFLRNADRRPAGAADGGGQQ